jgi:chitinase
VPAANRVPVVSITAPVNNALFAPGVNVTFSGTAIDAEDGVLSGSALVWTSSRDGQIGTGASISTRALSVGVHTITLTAKDSQNAIGSATSTVTIKIVRLQ